MKTLELNQMEEIQGGYCTKQEKMSAGVTMIVLGTLSFGTLALLFGLGVAMVCLSPAPGEFW